MKNKPSFKLQDISDWTISEEVDLPKVQRGFVWRPYQIENLWDSLLRRYPIGAFVLSLQKKSSKKFELLDGQQRATSICLGFGKSAFKLTRGEMKLFIDLVKPDPSDNRKYFFRVITKSHPWGYELTDNTKTLSTKFKHLLMKLCGEEDYLNADLDNFFPYDSILALPFNYFLEAGIKNESNRTLIETIKKWPLFKKVKKSLIDWLDENPSEKTEHPDYILLTRQDEIEKRIGEIYEDVKAMLQHQTVPTLYLDLERLNLPIQELKRSGTNQSRISGQIQNKKIEEEEYEKEDEIENLFTRLNAGGTPLRGEDLNYSILKAHILKDLQDKIENACEAFIQPSRFITIAYRLFQHYYKQDTFDSLSMRIKPKQFQKAFNRKKDRNTFEEFLKDLLVSNKYDSNTKTLLEYSQFLLEYNKEYNAYGLPHLITAKIADSAPEIMFMFLYRLLVKKDDFKFDSDIHKQMLGIISLFMWLGKGERRRDYSRLLSNIWPCAEKLDQKELFWSSAIVNRARIKEVLTPFPTFSKKYDRKSISAQLLGIDATPRKDILAKLENESDFWGFFNKMLWNDDLVLYAQRDFLSSMFNKKQFYQDDTNLPFDWDHISPYKLLSKKNLPIPITALYNTIGNRRAWPFSLNRTDQDDVPAIKLNPLEREIDTDDKIKEIEMSWLSFISKNIHLIQKKEQLRDRLLDWSICSEKWLSCDVNDLKNGDWKLVYDLILSRTLSIIGEWYENLNIVSLKAVDNKAAFLDHIDKRKWKLNPRLDNDLQEYFDSNEYNYIVSSIISLENSKVSFYIIYDEDDLLEENSISFGLLEYKPNNFISSLKIPEKFKTTYDTDSSKSWVEGKFTLLSRDDNFYFDLFKDFSSWLSLLNKFSKNDMKEFENIFINFLPEKMKINIS